MAEHFDPWTVMRDAASRLHDDAEMIRALTTFMDFWGLDCYTPPPAVMANVSDLVTVFTYAAKTGASGTAGYVPASEVQRAREEALVAGWEACRLSVYAVCEDAREKALNGLTDDAGDHEYGFYSGEANLAKSIARGFNSMEACDDNNLAAARRALAAPPAENGEG